MRDSRNARGGQLTRTSLKRVPRQIGDGIGLLHFVFANLLVGVGEITPWFNEFGWPLPGLQFVYKFIDTPLALFFQSWTVAQADTMSMFLIGELIIIASSLLYGILAYVFARLVFSIIDY